MKGTEGYNEVPYIPQGTNHERKKLLPHIACLPELPMGIVVVVSSHATDGDRRCHHLGALRGL